MDNNNWLSIYLLAPLFGWLVAHIVKFVLTLIASGGKVRDPGIFLRAGGMPSSHSAVIIATLTVIGARQGVGSAIFGLGVAVAAIIMYDAVNVRRSVGEQGDVLRKVAAHTKVEQPFFTAYGHSFTEVVGGIIVGLFVGWILLQIL
jgi:acid phosphatase family membrane protein YuiD